MAPLIPNRFSIITLSRKAKSVAAALAMAIAPPAFAGVEQAEEAAVSPPTAVGPAVPVVIEGPVAAPTATDLALVELFRRVAELERKTQVLHRIIGAHIKQEQEEFEAFRDAQKAFAEKLQASDKTDKELQQKLDAETTERARQAKLMLETMANNQTAALASDQKTKAALEANAAQLKDLAKKLEAAMAEKDKVKVTDVLNTIVTVIGKAFDFLRPLIFGPIAAK